MSDAATLPNSELTLWRESLPGGAHWSGVLRRGCSLTVVDINGGANVSMLFYNWENKLERYNMADTLKGQHTAFLTVDNACYSDMGRVICSITQDSCGWHDTISGVSNAQSVKARYGEGTYQSLHNDYYRNGYDSLINELGKYGLNRRDLVSNINLFSKVTVGDNGDMEYHPNNSQPGDSVTLRFEMEALVVLSTCQHPLDPASSYKPSDIELIAWKSGVATPDDPCRLRCPENERAYINTERFYAGCS